MHRQNPASTNRQNPGKEIQFLCYMNLRIIYPGRRDRFSIGSELINRVRVIDQIDTESSKRFCLSCVLLHLICLCWVGDGSLPLLPTLIKPTVPSSTDSTSIYGRQKVRLGSSLNHASQEFRVGRTCLYFPFHSSQVDGKFMALLWAHIKQANSTFRMCSFTALN